MRISAPRAAALAVLLIATFATVGCGELPTPDAVQLELPPRLPVRHAVLELPMPDLGTTGALAAEDRPELKGDLLNGHQFDWMKYRGRVVLVIFWASWSPDARPAVNAVRSLRQKYRSAGLEVVGVSSDQSLDKAKQFASEALIDWECIFDKSAEGANAQYNKSEKLPAFLLIDRDGHTVRGDLRDPKFTATFKRLLDSPAPDGMDVRKPVAMDRTEEELQAVGPAAPADPGDSAGGAVTASPPSLVASGFAREKLPRVAGKLVNGRQFKWADYEDKVVLLWFWGSWCPECVKAAPLIGELAEKFGDRGFEVVGVIVQDDAKRSRSFIEQQNWDFANIDDPNVKLYRALINTPGVLAAGSSLLVDRRGRKVIGAPDPRDTVAFEQVVGELLAETDASPVPTRLGGDREAADEDEPAGEDTPMAATPKKKTAKGKLKEAKTGVGKKGRGYGGGVLTEPIRTKFRAEQRIVFDIEIPKAMQFFQATNGRVPKSHEEFMKEIIEANDIKLPELPEGQEYVYDPETGKLMVGGAEE